MPSDKYKELNSAIEKALRYLPDALALAESHVENVAALTQQLEQRQSEREPVHKRAVAAAHALRTLEAIEETTVKPTVGDAVARSVANITNTAIPQAEAERQAANQQLWDANFAVSAARIELWDATRPLKPFRDLQTRLNRMPRKVRLSTLCRVAASSGALQSDADQMMAVVSSWYPVLREHALRAQEYEHLLRAHHTMQHCTCHAPTESNKEAEAELLRQALEALSAKVLLERQANAALDCVKPIVLFKQAIDKVVAELQALSKLECPCSTCKAARTPGS